MAEKFNVAKVKKNSSSSTISIPFDISLLEPYLVQVLLKHCQTATAIS